MSTSVSPMSTASALVQPCSPALSTQSTDPRFRPLEYRVRRVPRVPCPQSTLPHYPTQVNYVAMALVPFSHGEAVSGAHAVAARHIDNAILWDKVSTQYPPSS
jgi:hypothetical protein